MAELRRRQPQPNQLILEESPDDEPNRYPSVWYNYKLHLAGLFSFLFLKQPLVLEESPNNDEPGRYPSVWYKDKLHLIGFFSFLLLYTFLAVTQEEDVHFLAVMMNDTKSFITNETTQIYRPKRERLPCRVAITNSMEAHYEILESVAALYPLTYLPLSRRRCIGVTITFDYHIYESPQRRRGPNRLESWVEYFGKHLKNTSFPAQPRQPQRRIGTLTRYVGLPLDSGINPRGYHATIEVSCYCLVHGQPRPRWLENAPNHVNWTMDDITNACIFHEPCEEMTYWPTATWLSPQHYHYFLPTALPKIPPKPIDQVQEIEILDEENEDTPKQPKQPLPVLCVVGNTERRQWRLLQHYYSDQSSSLFRLQILGFGPFPSELSPYENTTFVDVTSAVDHLEFHTRVAHECDAILTLVTMIEQPDYFGVERVDDVMGQKKLLIALPFIIAYQKPTVLHQELYDLYKPHLPPDLLVATHTDEESSFVEAMNAFLPKLLALGAKP